MILQFEHWEILNLTLQKVEGQKENIFKFGYVAIYPDDEVQTFGVRFDMRVTGQSFDLEIEALFMFKTSEKIDDDFKLSDFPKINAPAIVFPYLRAYISNLTMQSGFEPVILPSINFVKLAEE